MYTFTKEKYCLNQSLAIYGLWTKPSPKLYLYSLWAKNGLSGLKGYQGKKINKEYATETYVAQKV